MDREQINKIYSDYLNDCETEHDMEQIFTLAYKAIPSVEPKEGHWEWLTEDKYRCSNCNHETRVDECMNEPMYDFCPFCGAKMYEIIKEYEEPKLGHWIDLKEDNEMSDDDMWRYSCNMCHGQNFRKTLFCPNCGCAMFEPQESEEV